MTPALGVQTVTPARSPDHGPPPATPRSGATATTARVQPTSTVMPLTPHVCRGEETIGCRTHHAHTLYVRLPVPVGGKQWVGVSTDAVDCSSVPGTPVTQCDTTGGTR